MNVIGPVVAGRFYPAEEDELIDSIESCFTHDYGPGSLPDSMEKPLDQPVGMVVPHAGYPYSGPIAAHAYRWLSKVGKPESVVIIGTNHTGVGSDVSVLVEGGWKTPLGVTKVNSDLAHKLVDRSEVMTEDSTAFVREHSVEAQLPFLQYLFGNDFSIVPICPLDQSEDTAVEIAGTIASESPTGTLLIASSDFSHYETQEVAENKDTKAIESIVSGDIDQFYDRVKRLKISICGYGAIGTVMSFSHREDLVAEKLQYATSGKVAGMGGEVVGYCAIGFKG